MNYRYLYVCLLIFFYTFPFGHIHAQPADSPWPMFRHDLKHTGRSSYTGSGNNYLQWVYPVGSSTSTPAIGTDSTIYVGSYDGNLYAMNPDGTLQWKYTTGDTIESSPAVGTDGVIYVGSNDNYIYAVKPDGTLKWKYLTNDNVVSSPAIGTNSTIYVGSYDGHLYVMDSNGSLKKSPPPSLGNQIYSSPAVGNNEVVYVGSRNNNILYSFDSNLSTQWSRKLLGQIESSPAIDSNETVYIGADRLYAFTSSDYWAYETTNGLPITSSPAVSARNEIYFGAESGFYALYSTGNVKRIVNTIGAIGKSSPAIDAKGYVYICSEKGLYALDTNYDVKWTYPIKDGDASPIIGSDGTIYVHSSDGYLYAVGTASAVVKTIATDKSSLDIIDGKSGTLTATLYDASNLLLSDVPIKASVENGLIATVTPGSATTDTNGQAVFTVNGDAVGETALSLTANNTSDSIPITVSPRSGLVLYSLDINPQTFSLVKNSAKTITIKTLDANGIRIPNVYVKATNNNTGSVSIEEVQVTDDSGEATFSATATEEGTAFITFTAHSVSGTVTINVVVPYSIELEPTSLDIKEHQSESVTALVKDNDGNVLAGQVVTAEASGADIATIDAQKTTDENGEASFTVTGISAGDTNITFSSGSATASLLVSVVSDTEVTSINIEPDKLNIPLGYRGTATVSVWDQEGSPLSGINVHAASDDVSIAVVDDDKKTNTDGQVFFGIDGISTGSTTVHFTADSISNSLSVSVIDVIPSSLTLDTKKLTVSIGSAGTVTAAVLDQYNDPIPNINVEADSDNAAIATVDLNKTTNAHGKASFGISGNSAGSTTVTFKVGDLSAPAFITVTEQVPSKLSINKDSLELSQCEDESITVRVFDNTDTGISDITVDASLSKKESRRPSVGIEPSGALTDEDGKVSFALTGLRKGRTVIKFNTDNLRKKFKVTVKKTRIVPLGTKDRIIITVLENNKPRSGIEILAKSGDTDIITVNRRKTTDTNGEARFIVTGVGEGSAVITFTTKTGTSELEENITVIKTAAVELSESDLSISAGTSHDVTITALDADGNPVPDTGVYTSLIKGGKYIEITPAQTTTDENGIATFTIKGVTAGKAEAKIGVCGMLKSARIKIVP